MLQQMSSTPSHAGFSLCHWSTLKYVNRYLGAFKISPALSKLVQVFLLMKEREKLGSGRKSETLSETSGCLAGRRGHMLAPWTHCLYLSVTPLSALLCAVSKGETHLGICVLPPTLSYHNCQKHVLSTSPHPIPTPPPQTMALPQGSWSCKIMWCIYGLKWPWKCLWKEKPIAKARLRPLCCVARRG